MIDNKKAIKYPKVIGKKYLFTYLEELGFGSITGMGDRSQITFVEIEAYANVTHTQLSHWEVMAIRTLSLEYIIQSNKKEKSDFPPFMDGMDEFTYLNSLRK